MIASREISKWSSSSKEGMPGDMLLAVDVGNSNTVIGLCSGDEVADVWRLSTRSDRMPDEWFAILAPLLGAAGCETSSIDGVVLSSVVPTVTRWFSDMSRSRFRVEPVVVSTDLDLGFRAIVDRPSEVGADRLANTMAAYHRYGGPALVIDFGTATNFDAVSADGNFLGGAIAPGLMISLEALTGKAARLFAVDLDFPDRAIGTNTVTNIHSGLMFGYLAMLEGLIHRFKAELGSGTRVIATGGLAERFTAATAQIDHYDPDLVIEGLRLIYARVRSGSS